VFADLAGSTTIGERLDPESFRQVMSRYYELVQSVLERHGGTVAKFIGDAVVAVFGVPVAREDDAVRAVRAAAEMEGALTEFGAELESRWDISLKLRTGVNTGEIVTGDSEGEESHLLGDAINVAARLEQAADPGEILLGEQTYGLVCDAVEAVPIEPLSLKGKSEPVRAFKLTQVVAGAPGHARRLDSPLVGRERELELLHQCFERAASEQRCSVVTLMGVAGVGKSRLVQELITRLGDRARVLQGHCIPYGDGITFWPIAEVVKEAARVAEEDSAEEAQSKIRALLPPDEDSDRIAQQVAGVLGISEGTTRPDETFWTIRKVLEAIAGDRPLVLVFDDIHWGEPTFLDLIEYLGCFSREQAMLLVNMARPELAELRPDWATVIPDARTLTLGVLEAEESELLIHNLLGEGELSEDVSDYVGRAAEGNPLFAEEMLRMLVDEGILRREDGRWAPTHRLSAVQVPPTIHALLNARLDRLEAPEREVIERAAVIGAVFSGRAVLELSPEPDRSGVWGHLQRLARKELIRPHQSPVLAEEDGYRFGHILIRDVAYERMLKQVRSELHERFASWLEEKVGERATEYDEILAYHLEQAYKVRVELGSMNGAGRMIAERAAERLSRAGRRALARGDMPAAVNLLERALSLLPADDPSRVDLMLKVGIALQNVAAMERADVILKETVAAATASGDRRLELNSRLELALFRLFSDPDSDLDAASALAYEAIPLFEALGDESGLSRAWRVLGARSCVRNGRFGEATEELERALEHAWRGGDEMQASEIFQWLVVTRFLGPLRADEAIQSAEQFVRLAPDDRSAQAALMMLRGGFAVMAGQFEEARDLCRTGRAVYEELGLRRKLAVMTMITAMADMTAGDPVTAERDLRWAFEVLESVGERAWLAPAAAMCAHALIAQGRNEEAEEFITMAERSAHNADVWVRVTSRVIRAMLLLRAAEFERAAALARQAVDLVEKTDWLMLRGYSWTILALILHMKGERSEGSEALEHALRSYAEKGDTATSAQTRKLFSQFQQ
jgi:class 3 adenylate cyclase/tetratricopeptide (TPR) repeat protein